MAGVYCTSRNFAEVGDGSAHVGEHAMTSFMRRLETRIVRHIEELEKHVWPSIAVMIGIVTLAVYGIWYSWNDHYQRGNTIVLSLALTRSEFVVCRNCAEAPGWEPPPPTSSRGYSIKWLLRCQKAKC